MARIPGRTHTKALLLNGHLDTVPHGCGWSSSAGAATQRDGKIYGRGASDMKSGLAALIDVFSMSGHVFDLLSASFNLLCLTSLDKGTQPFVVCDG